MTRADGSQRRRERATIEDVAAAAGVSVATVSRALRNLPNVAASTRERVQGIATDLGYRADPLATRLATGRTRTIGVVVPFLNTWYFSNVVAGVEAVCTDAGYDTLVICVGSAEQRHRLITDADGTLRRIDGIVLVDLACTEGQLRTLADHGLDIVSVGPHSALFPSVGIDDVAVGRIAAQHLLDLGHRRIGVIRGQASDPFEFEVPKHRLDGIQRACRDAGVAVDDALSMSGNFSIAGGYEATLAMLGTDHPPTAVLALSDEMAIGAVHAARKLGVGVPGDLSIIGIDDHEMSIVIDLTTVRQVVSDRGAHAARLLLDRLGGASRTPLRVNGAIELVVRGTTAPPRR